jgi:hypothetical protein
MITLITNISNNFGLHCHFSAALLVAYFVIAKDGRVGMRPRSQDTLLVFACQTCC